MKKKRRLALGLILLFILIGGIETVGAEDYLPLSVQQGIVEVAQKYGSPQQFMNEVFAGRNKARPVVYPTRTKFVWVVDNEGWPRQTYQPGQIAGWEYTANVSGRQIIFFYPADGSFIFGIPARVPTQKPIAAEVRPYVPMAVKPNRIAVTESKVQAPMRQQLPESPAPQRLIPEKEKTEKPDFPKHQQSGKTVIVD